MVLPPNDVLCRICWDRLLSARLKGVDTKIDSYPFPVHALFVWNPGTDGILRPLIKAIKKARASSAIWRLAAQLSFEISEAKGSGAIDEKPIFVIPPRPRGRNRDHAWILGKSFSKIWEGDFFDVLADASPFLDRASGQKSKRREERMLTRFTPVSTAQIPKSRQFVFADDIITTGSTAMAAYLALEDPAKFEVWTLVHRPKLATSRGI